MLRVLVMTYTVYHTRNATIYYRDFVHDFCAVLLCRRGHVLEFLKRRYLPTYTRRTQTSFVYIIIIIILRLKKRKKKKRYRGDKLQRVLSAPIQYTQVPRSIGSCGCSCGPRDRRLPRRSYNNNNNNVCAQYDNFFNDNILLYCNATTQPRYYPRIGSGIKYKTWMGSPPAAAAAVDCSNIIL